MGEVTELAIAAARGIRRRLPGPKHLVYTISPSNALSIFGGEIGAFVVANQPKPEYAMSAEPQKKHEGWSIHASQANFMQESYLLPTWLDLPASGTRSSTPCATSRPTRWDDAGWRPRVAPLGARDET